MSRSFQSPSHPNAVPCTVRSNIWPHVWTFGARPSQSTSRITALNIEFVAKPDEAHKMQSALPAAIHGALGEVAGFAGSVVMIANHEARLVTVVTLWTGEDRLQRCSENLRWVRALLNPYLDRCLRVQTFSAHVSETKGIPQELEPSLGAESTETAENEEEAICAA